ncbi:hypothetical protein BGZ65_002944 [Modicella reniformis]|uniref:SAP30-binding protein n=1 Tax=Modicella reniformis TaxID=1440133 RepID=A0A9P6M9H2_9FUNG|nr:hypothetical protein BGZ65_002944 [Modicella reniformis]
MNRGMGLVAYGDSDSENSDEDTLMATAPKATGTPSSQNTISAQSIVNAKLSATDSLNKFASTNLLKQGVATPGATSTPGEQSPAIGESSSIPRSFSQSLSETLLAADHSAAAEVLNTPTGGRSPLPQTEAISIEDSQDVDGEVHRKQSRVEQMRLLLRPRPIPGVDNFGIPPNPEGEVNLDVQAKIEQFQSVKVTRGIHFNQSLMKNKNFRNPRIYASLVEFVDLNETGSNFEKGEFFDFEGYGPESYATGIAEAQKQAAEKLAQQQALPRSQLQFMHGTSGQASAVTVGGGIGIARPSTSSTPVSAAATAGTQRARKSKWDMPQTTDGPASKRARS